MRSNRPLQAFRNLVRIVRALDEQAYGRLCGILAVTYQDRSSSHFTGAYLGIDDLLVLSVSFGRRLMPLATETGRVLERSAVLRVHGLRHERDTHIVRAGQGTLISAHELLYSDSEWSRIVSKRPRPGDIREQPILLREAHALVSTALIEAECRILDEGTDIINWPDAYLVFPESQPPVPEPTPDLVECAGSSEPSALAAALQSKTVNLSEGTILIPQIFLCRDPYAAYQCHPTDGSPLPTGTEDPKWIRSRDDDHWIPRAQEAQELAFDMRSSLGRTSMAHWYVMSRAGFRHGLREASLRTGPAADWDLHVARHLAPALQNRADNPLFWRLAADYAMVAGPDADSLTPEQVYERLISREPAQVTTYHARVECRRFTQPSRDSMRLYRPGVDLDLWPLPEQFRYLDFAEHRPGKPWRRMKGRNSTTLSDVR